MINLQSTFTLSNGVKMPCLGLGVWKVESREELVQAVHSAIDTGYKMIDTATAYSNEDFVGDALATASVKREDIFLTTKLWNAHQEYDEALRAFDRSLKMLKTDYVDLYLIHWPVPKYDLYPQAWKALVRLYEEKKIRAIGVCNFKPHHIERLQNETGILPMVNQVECHPLHQQWELLEYCQKMGILMEAYSPLLSGNLGEVSDRLTSIAAKHGKTPAQVCIRWQIQRGVVVIPKSVHTNRIIENANVFDFTLDEEDMKAIAALNQNRHFLPDPDVANFR